jgi:hypothetical protein
VVIVSIMEQWPIAIQENYSANESVNCGSRRGLSQEKLAELAKLHRNTSARSNEVRRMSE